MLWQTQEKKTSQTCREAQVFQWKHEALCGREGSNRKKRFNSLSRHILEFPIISILVELHEIIVMQEASDAHSKTADSDTVSTYQVSSVQLVTDKKLEAFNKA